ncbi:hypothetical protein E2C01_068988 [Portunus trituberculatus]|uniref:Uncharacterized protein n=1 Tax=Portunus trituberculatus TaxID=210409 RepID=A0A5B7HTG9_PORTR|nr:hypothetical protein [Portunus trituberculatus]
MAHFAWYTLAKDCLTGKAMIPAASREKPLFWKRRWRVSTREDEVLLEICEKGVDEADVTANPTEATLSGDLLIDSAAEGTSLHEATKEQLETRGQPRSL